MNAKPTIYCDMDGFLAKYNYDMYTQKNNELPSYMTPDAHVYAQLPPDKTAIELFNALYKMPAVHTKILTGLGCPYLISEHALDKLSWISSYIDTFKNKDFICVYGSKTEAVKHLKELTPLDILIDDYNPNLDDWRNNGGTAIKYVNGINSYRDDILCLNYADTYENNMEHLMKHILCL